MSWLPGWRQVETQAVLCQAINWVEGGGAYYRRRQVPYTQLGRSRGKHCEIKFIGKMEKLNVLFICELRDNARFRV